MTSTAKTAKEAKKQLSCCQKFVRISYMVMLILAFISFIIITALHSYASSSHYIMSPHKWQMFKAATESMVSIFSVFYLLAAIIVLCKFCQSRRLCRMDNCTFYISTIGMLTMSLLGYDYVLQARNAHEEDFALTCGEVAVIEETDIESSFLAEANKFYHDASRLLCNNACPCALRTVGSGRQLRGPQIDLDEGAVMVQDCKSYLTDVFNADEDKRDQFADVFEELEEEHSCSGICSGIETDPNEFFLFSNVNNGEPLVSCKEPLSELVDKNMKFFGKVYLSVAGITGIILFVVICLLVMQIWLYCKKKCCPQKGAQYGGDKGTFVGGPDQDEGDSDIEMSEQKGKKAKGKAKETSKGPKMPEEEEKEGAPKGQERV